jgi:hypothetical protein
VGVSILFYIKNSMKLTYKDWLLEYVIEWDTLFVLSIFVEERRQWTATKLMNMLLEKSREEDVSVIELPVMSFDSEEWMETEELKDWCERMWFEIVEKYSIGDNKWYAMRMEL